MVDKSLKDLQQECRILKLPIPGRKSELKDRIRRARSGQTTIIFTPRKRGRPPEEEDGELLGTPLKKGRASTALPSPEVKTEVREGPTKPPSNKDEHGHQNESIQKNKEITGIKEGEGGQTLEQEIEDGETFNLKPRPKEHIQSPTQQYTANNPTMDNTLNPPKYTT